MAYIFYERGGAMTEILEEDFYDVELMNLIVDKAENLKVVDSDSHFSEFAGVHPSKIKQGKLFLHDIIKPAYRENIMKSLCKKNSPYVYFDAEFIDKNKNEVLIHCTGQNFEESTLCRLTLADVSKSLQKQEALREKAREMNYLIDLVTGGVCLFKVTDDMHIVVQYLNEGGCRLFGTSKSRYVKQDYRLDELIHPEDRSLVYQAIGKTMATDEPIDIEFRTIVHKDEYKWCKVNAAIQSYDENDNPIFHAMLTDVTKVKEAEEKADKMYDNLVEVFKNLPNAVFSTDTENPLTLQIVSEDFIKFLGWSRTVLFDEHEGRLSDFMQEREIRYVTANIKKQLEEGKKEIITNYSIRTGKGKFLVVEDRRKVINQDDGSQSMLCSLKNVTKKYHSKTANGID